MLRVVNLTWQAGGASTGTPALGRDAQQSADDDDATRAQKATLTIAALCVIGLAVIWVVTYWLLGIPQAAAIPFAYQIASVASLIVFARSRSYRFLRTSQAAMMSSCRSSFNGLWAATSPPARSAGGRSWRRSERCSSPPRASIPWFARSSP